MKRTVSLIALLLIAATLFASCGDVNAPADTTKAEVSSVIEDSHAADGTTAEDTTAEITTAEATTAEATTAEVTTAEVTTAEVTTAEVTTAEVTTAEVTTAEVTTAEVTTAEVTTAEVTTAEVTTAEVTTAEITTAEITTAPVTEPVTTKPEPPAEPAASLNGKKFIFIGNSMIYYGGVVTKGSQRSTDKGVFYNVCKANGDSVTVYDCAYGDHSLSDFLTKGCSVSGCGTSGDHLAGVDLYSIDYVIMSEAGNNNSNFIRDVKNVMARFQNPNTVFVYMCHTYSYTKTHTNITSNLSALQKLGVVIVDWGHVCFDVYKGNAKVEGATQSYVKNTFVNNTSSDSHHPNPLAGYIASQMVYCALTGKSAVGQSYSFMTSLKFGSGSVTYADYSSKYYTAGTSNFDAVFKSAKDMQGLQKLMDKYLNNFKVGAGYDAPKPIPACNHVFDAGRVVTEPTDKLPGLRVYTCTLCKFEKEESIPMLESADTNVAKGCAATMYSVSKTSIGTGSVFTDGKIGDNANGRTDGSFTASGSADAYGGKKAADTTEKLKIKASDGSTYEYYYAVKVDLGQTRTVKGVTVYAQGYKKPVLDSGADILVSADGQTWTRVYQGTNMFTGTKDGKGWENYVDSTTAGATAIPPAYLAVNFAEQSGIRYVMYGCTATREINGYYTARFTEFEVYGK